jgi:hypothetical protein
MGVIVILLIAIYVPVLVWIFRTARRRSSAWIIRNLPYIYVKGESAWPTTPTATFTDPGGTSDDYFGNSVAVSGTTAIVGANWPADGPVYIYVKGSSGWPTTPSAGMTHPVAAAEYFGYSVAVSGRIAIVGAWGTHRRDTGAAYIYRG